MERLPLPSPPRRTCQASLRACEGPLGGYAAAAEARLLAALPDHVIVAWARSQERLESARATLSRSTELIAHSNDVLARSAGLLAPVARGRAAAAGRGRASGP